MIEQRCPLPSAEKYFIRPHVDAPFFRTGHADVQRIIEQLISAATSANFDGNGETVDLLRQLALCSLFFFLKHVAGYSISPYNLLNDHIHLDMCNFRQSDFCMSDGSRAAAFLPRGYYKSECAGSRVLTPDFYKLVEDVKTGDYLLTRKGPRRVRAVSSSEEPCYEVCLRSGRKICGADYHAVKTLLSWTELRSLQPGDHVGVDAIEVRTECALEDDTAYLLGCIYGDGSVTGGMIHITNFDSEVVDRLKRAWPEYTIDGKRGRFTLRGGMKWFRNLGLPLQLAVNKTYPRIAEGSVHFLRGLFDCDGFAHETGSYANYVTASEDLALGIQRNLGRLGIFSSVHNYSTNSPHGICFHVQISGRSELSRFVRIVGSEIPRKFDRMLRGLPGLSVRDFIPPEWRSRLGYGDGFTLRKLGLRIDNLYSSSRRKVRKAAEILNRPDILDLATDSLIWDKVETVKSVGTNVVYHIEVEGEHEYESESRIVNHNSTIFTHGADAWEALRNPDIAINIRNAIVDNAVDFMRNVRAVFDSNLFVEALFPSHYVQNPKAQPRWNETEIVLPNRRMRQVEATVSAGGMTGAGEGKHFDILNVDDPVGLDDLTVENAGNMQMYAKMRWCRTNFRALLRSPHRSRIMLVQTRFAVDDTSSLPLSDLKAVYGYALEEFEPKPTGRWTVYNRVPLENGKEVFPEVIKTDELNAALEEDQWAASTQLFNRPSKAGMSEFADMPVKRARFVFDESSAADHYVICGGRDNFDDVEKRVYLKNMDIVAAVDPAGTEPGIAAKACRTALVVVGQDSKERTVVLKVRADHFAVGTWFNEIFKMHQTEALRGKIREWAVESNAMQKILKPLLDAEKLKRSVYVNFQAVPSSTDKIARIRETLGRLAQSGLLYSCEECFATVFEEWKHFPQLKFKMDVLDALEKAVSRLRKPLTDEQEDDIEEQEEAFFFNRSVVSGY